MSANKTIGGCHLSNEVFAAHLVSHDSDLFWGPDLMYAWLESIFPEKAFGASFALYLSFHDVFAVVAFNKCLRGFERLSVIVRYLLVWHLYAVILKQLKGLKLMQVHVSLRYGQ